MPLRTVSLDSRPQQGPRGLSSAHCAAREHRGRTVKTTGDGLLVEFASVVDAVRRVEVQRETIARNTNVPAEQRLEPRMGINVGDIFIEGGDIFIVEVGPRQLSRAVAQTWPRR